MVTALPTKPGKSRVSPRLKEAKPSDPSGIETREPGLKIGKPGFYTSEPGKIGSNTSNTGEFEEKLARNPLVSLEGWVGRPRKRPSVKAITKKGGRVVYRVLATIAGAQQKRIFKTREEADLQAAAWGGAQDQSFQFYPTRFSANELRDAEAAQRIVATFGLTLVEAAIFSTRHYKVGALKVPPLGECIAQYLTSRADRSVSHQKSLRNTLHRLAKYVETTDLNKIETAHLTDWLKIITAGGKPKTFNTLLENLCAFFNWAQAKGWLLKSPAIGIERLKVRKKMPKVLSPEQAEQLMAYVERCHPELVPYFALCLFGAVRPGIREGECARLDAKVRAGERPVMGGGILIEGKTGKERIFPWNPPLRAWLDAYPLGDCLLPGGEHAADSLIAKIRQHHRLTHDVMRHTGITAMALTIDSIVETAIACDTSETIIRRSYLGNWTKLDAERFNAIRPKLERTPCSTSCNELSHDRSA